MQKELGAEPKAFPGSVFIAMDYSFNPIAIVLGNGERDFLTFLMDQLCAVIPGDPLPGRSFLRYDLPDISGLEYRPSDNLQAYYKENLRHACQDQNVGKPTYIIHLHDLVYNLQHDMQLLRQPGEDVSVSQIEYYNETAKIRNSAPDLTGKLEAITGRKIHPEGIKYLFATYDSNLRLRQVVPGTQAEADYMRFLLDAMSRAEPGKPFPDERYSRLAYYPERGIGAIVQEPDTPARMEKLLNVAVLLTGSAKYDISQEALAYRLQQNKLFSVPLHYELCMEADYFSVTGKYKLSAPDLSCEIAAARRALDPERTAKRHIPSRQPPKRKPKQSF